jgi:hypothetical protein
MCIINILGCTLYNCLQRCTMLYKSGHHLELAVMHMLCICCTYVVQPLCSHIQLCNTLYNSIHSCKRCTALLNIVQLCTIVYNCFTTLYNIVKQCTTLYNTIKPRQPCTVFDNIVHSHVQPYPTLHQYTILLTMYSLLKHCITVYNLLQPCTAQPCKLFYNLVQHCTTLYNSVQPCTTL